MPWYRSGTVAITAGQTSVVGTNTDFAANARVGDAFQGPDGRWYEVANIASATVLSILPAYQGFHGSRGAAEGAAYLQSLIPTSTDRLRFGLSDKAFTASVVPEAPQVLMMGLGLLGLAARRKKQS